MIFVRLAEAMYVVHHYVYAQPKRVGEIICTTMPLAYPCGADYTQNGNFSAANMNASTFERFYQTKL